jgi:CRP/FNR family transcriptional regulator
VLEAPASLAVLRQVPYFADLDAAGLARIEERLVERRYERGHAVFMEGGACQGLYVVRAGRVRIYKVSPEGREQVLMVAGAGETFNEVPNFDGGANPASAEALEPSVLYLLPKADLLSIVETEPVVARAIMRVFASHLRHLTVLVEDLSFRNVTSRVAKILLGQVQRAEAPGRAPVEAGARPARLTQQQMAAMAGTAREVVGRALKALEQQGIIRVERGRVVVVSPERLADIV